MVPKGLLVTPETWRVARKDGRFVLISHTSGKPLEQESELRQIEVMHGMAVWSILANQLEITNGKLLNRVMAASNQHRADARLIDQNHATLALATPSPEAVAELLSTTTQLHLWREAA